MPTMATPTRISFPEGFVFLTSLPLLERRFGWSMMNGKTDVMYLV